jgi:hypothetical protein
MVVSLATTLTLITRIRAAGIHSLDIQRIARKCHRLAKLRKIESVACNIHPRAALVERPYREEYFEIERVQNARARHLCSDANGSEPWACCDPDCTDLKLDCERQGRRSSKRSTRPSGLARRSGRPRRCRFSGIRKNFAPANFLQCIPLNACGFSYNSRRHAHSGAKKG